MATGRCTFCGSENISEPTHVRSWTGGPLYLEWDTPREVKPLKVKDVRVLGFAGQARICAACGHVMFFAGPKTRASAAAQWAQLRPVADEHDSGVDKV
jgi:hypothetical protein